MQNEKNNEFIIKAIKVHGDRYGYTLVDVKYYSKDKVDIICKKHGIFSQLPSGHLQGYGCTKCGYEHIVNNSRRSEEEFISKAKKIHNDYYGYDDINYQGSTVKIPIKCPKHGIFEQSPSGHLQGYGCPKCANERNSDIQRHTIDTFITDARSVHGDTYGYDNSIYVRNDIKLDIICNIHGIFSMTPTSHIHGKQGCPKCGFIKRTISRSNGKERFIELANIKHNNYYIIDSNRIFTVS